MTQLNVPAPIGRGYADSTIPIIPVQQINEMGAFIKSAIGMIVTDVQPTPSGNLRILGQASDGSPVDVTLALMGTSQDIREIHYALQMTYNMADTQFEGALLYGDTDELTQGNQILFRIPTNRPDLHTRAMIKIDSEAAPQPVRDYSNHIRYVDELIPGQIYWAIVIPTGYLLLDPLGGLNISLTTSRTVTTAELKALDTTPVEIIPAPGAGQYLEVEQISVNKLGDDQLKERVSAKRAWTSTSAVPIESEALAGHTEDSRGSDFRVDFDDWIDTGEDRYIYLSEGQDQSNLQIGIILSGRAYYSDDRFPNFDDYSKLPDLLTIDGEPSIVYRSLVTYTGIADWSNAGSNAELVFRDAGLGVDDIPGFFWAGLMFQIDDTALFPLAAGSSYVSFPAILTSTLGFYAAARVWEYGDDLFTEAPFSGAYTLGSQELVEDRALIFGSIARSRNAVTASSQLLFSSIYDLAMSTIQDVSLEFTVRYRVLEVT